MFVPRLAAVLSLLAATGCGGATQPADAPPSAAEIAHPLRGKPLPAFRRRTIAEAELDTRAMAGRAVVVKFFARYCEPCKRSLPAAERLSKELPQVSFVGIAEDEHLADAAEMVQTSGVSFPVVHDPGHVLGGRFRVSELPLTFLVDRSGTIVSVLGPGDDESAFRSAVERVAR